MAEEFGTNFPKSTNLLDQQLKKGVNAQLKSLLYDIINGYFTFMAA